MFFKKILKNVKISKSITYYTTMVQDSSYRFDLEDKFLTESLINNTTISYHFNYITHLEKDLGKRAVILSITTEAEPITNDQIFELVNRAEILPGLYPSVNCNSNYSSREETINYIKSLNLYNYKSIVTYIEK